MAGEMEDQWFWVRPPADADVASWLVDDAQEEEEEDEDRPPLKVLFTAPATHWTDAAPVGNGRLGAMIWGGVPFESIQLNHDTLWTGVPGDYTNPAAPAVLAEVRKLVDDGDYATASKAALDLQGHSPDVYQPLGDINIQFMDSDELSYTAYHREIDLATATVSVKYMVGDVEYKREHFCSNPHQVLVTKFSASKAGSLSFTVYLDSKLPHNSSVNGKNQIVMEGSCPGKRPASEGNESNNPSGIKFSAVLTLQVGSGKIQLLDERKLRVEGSDWAILLLAASSSFQGPFINPSDSTKDPKSETFSTLSRIKNMTYSQLFDYHLDDYSSLFNRVSLHLSKEKTFLSSKKFSGTGLLTNDQDSKKEMTISLDPVYSTISAAERVESFKDDEDPSMVELLFHYGQYLLISCSRPGTEVANLQGIWNKDVQPPWDAAPHMNINLQMNYWPSLPCNLSECQKPLFDFIASLAVNGTKTAKSNCLYSALSGLSDLKFGVHSAGSVKCAHIIKNLVPKVNYEANGWVAHQVTDIWAKTSPDAGDPVWALWPMGGAWLCTHLWEHYMFTMDKGFLENTAYPLLEGCALFLLDWLIDGRGGYMETNPSTSPEHYFIAPDGKTSSVSYSSTMDIAIIKEVLSAVISSAKVLGKSDSKLIQQIKSTLPKLPPTKIARDGSIMEWAQDFEDSDVHHRHISHLFGLFPGHSISVGKTPALCRAAENSLFKRGDQGPGWSTTWKMASWARLHNSEHAYKMIKQLINLVDPDHEADYEGGLYSNLFTAHPPFQIDANFGFTAAIAEMLVQSTENDLYLLPALPRDKWSKGCVKGLKARGCVTVNICWKEGELRKTWFWAKNGSSMIKRLHYNGRVATVSVSGGKVYTFNHQLECLKIHSPPRGIIL